MNIIIDMYDPKCTKTPYTFIKLDEFNITDEILSTKPGRSSPKIVITNCFINCASF
mgnify:CR=1 FL=1